MKIKIGLIICAFLFSNKSIATGKPEFIDFAVKQAHKYEFYGCDKAIKNTFRLAYGSDIRIIGDRFIETKEDSLKLTAITGSKGDSMFIEAEYRIKDGKCYTRETAIITVQESCSAYSSKQKGLNFISETADYVRLKGKGGISMFLKPVGSSCLVIIQPDSIF